MNDLRDFFKLLRYLLIFLVVIVVIAFYSKAHAADDTFKVTHVADFNLIGQQSDNEKCLAAYNSNYVDNTTPEGHKSFHIRYLKSDAYPSSRGYPHFVSMNEIDSVSAGNYGNCRITGHSIWSKVAPPKPPCETPKTDEQCKKGQRRQVTLPKSFWSQSTAEHKGCVISVESPGVGIANMGDDRATGHVNMMGSTGKSWCANTGTSDTTAQSIGASGEFTPTTTPKDCPKGSVTMGGQSWCYTGASDGVTKPDGSVPDDGIHDNGTSDDGNGGDVGSSIDREPGDGSGGDGGGGDTGGGGGGSGGGTGDGNGISKGDIKDGVKEGVEEALGKGSGAPAPIVLPTVDDVEGGINGVMGRYKQRINNAPISNAFNSISFSVPSAGCSPWGIHLDYLDVSLQFDQCTFLNTHSGMIGAIMMAMFAGLSVVVFLKA